MVTLPGEVHAGSFSFSDPNTGGSVTYKENNSTRAWIAAARQKGSLTIKITDAQPPVAGSSMVVNIHGTASATLPPVASSGAQDSIQMQVEF